MKMPPTPELPRNGATFKQAMNEPCYTADQVRALLLQYAESVREACARECEELAQTYHDREGTYPAGKKTGAFTCAAAIRRKEE